MTDGSAVTGVQPPAGPVKPAERHQILDLLRGFCLFGVLLSNLNHYSPRDPVTPADHGLAWAQEFLIQNRFYSLLGFLFGVGFAIQLGRADARGRTIVPTFYRRLLVLAAFGAWHGIFIWSGDVLTKFAVAGLLLPVFRRFPGPRMLLAGLGTWLITAYLWSLMAMLGVRLPTGVDHTQVYANGSYAEILPARAAEYWMTTSQVLARFGIITAPFLLLFVLGLWATRAGLLTALSDRQRRLRRATLSLGAVVVLGLLASLATEAWWPRPTIWPTWGSPGFLSPRWALANTLRRVPEFAITWGEAALYAVGVVWLARRIRPAVLAPLAAVGRMSLTTYLTQSIVSTLIFYGYGLGWLGKVSYAGMLAIAVAIFSAQLAGSAWWFRRFRFGPAEWLWRSLTYGERQPMRLQK